MELERTTISRLVVLLTVLCNISDRLSLPLVRVVPSIKEHSYQYQ